MKLEKIRDAAERVARSAGMDVWNVEWQAGKSRLLRIYLDRPPTAELPQGGKITHQDCEFVSQQLSVIIDVEDLVPGPSYVLEVSSPGLDRKLLKPEDYERFQGKKARLWLAQPVENQSVLDARLAGCKEGQVRLEVKERTIELPFTVIRKANLLVEF
jgi:ribosome maturation factor RimP